MGLIKKSDVLKRYENRQHVYDSISLEQDWASKQLTEAAATFSYAETYDVFLSHSYSDARIVKEIRDMLIDKDYSVYVDWLEDDHLDRGKVTNHTATVLRNRMNKCSSLIYLTSVSAQKSVWMPWELGYMDAKSGSVVVAPILDDDDSTFKGREYLGLYPYLDITNDSFYIHKDSESWVNISDWMRGKRP